MQTATLTMMEVPPVPKNDSRDAVFGLYERLIETFGAPSALLVIKTITAELGGMRVSIPDSEELARIQRNARIRARFTGCNHKELAIMFGCGESTIRRIVNGKER